MLWWIINFFDLGGDRYSQERIRVIREVGDKYEPKEGEKITESSYRELDKKQ